MQMFIFEIRIQFIYLFFPAKEHPLLFIVTSMRFSACGPLFVNSIYVDVLVKILRDTDRMYVEEIKNTKSNKEKKRGFNFYLFLPE